MYRQIILMKRFAAYLVKLRVCGTCLLSQIVLTIETAVKRLSFEEKKRKKPLKWVNQTKEFLDNIYVRKRIF